MVCDYRLSVCDVLRHSAMFCDGYAIFEIWILIFVLKFFNFFGMCF